MKRIIWGILVILVFGSACAQKVVKPELTKTKEISDAERMAWWEEARFGMFIHWGIYTVPAGFYKGEAQTNSAEWIMNKGKIPISEYEQFAKEFNPTKFNAKEFVALAKQAGMKYMVITAKHHDGFSMFDSKATDYNIVDATPFKRDVLKELAKECQEQGIKFGFYYSQAQDWHHPGGLGNTWDKDLKRVSSDEYVYEKALPEVKQLLTEYGPIAIFWWDTPRAMTKSVVDSLHHITTALQPRIITNDRLGDDYPGDHKTFERNGPRYQPEAKYWELCKPISGSWGYRSDDNDFNSVETLIHNLIDQSSKGGNFLLNVSPTREGTLRTEATDRLKAMGAWMDKNSEAIYGTQASPTSSEPNWGKITMKTVDNKGLLYLHVFDWKDGASLPIRLKNNVEACYLLTDKSRTFKTNAFEDGIQVKLTGEAPDSVASVIVLKLKEMPNALPQKALGQDESGVAILPAVRAQYENLQGPGALYNDHLDCVGSWDSETARVYWAFEIKKPGNFNMVAGYSGDKDTEITVLFNGVSKNVKIPASGDNPKRFKTVDLGNFKVDKAGKYELSLMPVAGKWNMINLKEVKIQPIKN
ncbi:alpha-L-fucosidase [Mariniflexile fucanivorans]|uniref:alpha-L-fucosidase n=1 Tax=Mariniflexile fucanivorans TaxID=264023 RepID=A0A4R1RJ73_9FLAO|nr:alpha-L-fucosidase [Mariniflexile fucanivorans]TCL66188.1 alpha-L-fucosidase [Mariniflexile fucanivorans]